MNTLIYAKMTHPENGYEHDQEKVEKLDPEFIYKLRDASMGQSSTSVYLNGEYGSFNSVNFTFYDKDMNEIDLRDVPEINHYRNW
jgi:hypothetical protein